MLAIPPLIALLDLVLSSTIGLEPQRAPIILGVLGFLVLLTSALLVQNEISKERMVYQYENRTRTLLVPYILSKVWLVGFLAIYQALVWMLIQFLPTGITYGMPVLVSYGITLFLVAFVGGFVGLIVSALQKSAINGTRWMLLLTVPQLIFSGAISPVRDLNFPLNLLPGVNPSRYALEALLITSGFGEGFGVTPVVHWFTLALMSLGLIVVLMGIQRRAGKRNP
jgi:hypothetical protein